jgi:hypothetical protein
MGIQAAYASGSFMLIHDPVEVGDQPGNTRLTPCGKE